MRDWGPFVQPCGWAEAPPMPQGKLLLANPSRGPFKKGWCFSLARGTPPSRISLEAETALRARFQQQQQLRGQSEVRRSGGGFYVTVEEEAGLGGFSTWLQMTRFHPFLWLKNTPFWMHIAVSSSLHQWMKRPLCSRSAGVYWRSTLGPVCLCHQHRLQNSKNCCLFLHCFPEGHLPDASQRSPV
nr:uncharacterized protein LOC105499832 isoform X4 [Macaca nemestrina]